MYSMKPKQYAIVKCSLGVIGLITSETEVEVTYADQNKGFAWTGVVLQTFDIPGIKGDAGKIIHIKQGNRWSSQSPEVLFYVNETTVFGHYDDVDYAHLSFMVDNFFKLQSFIESYNKEHEQHILPKMMIDHGFKLDTAFDTVNFESIQKIIDDNRMNTHATHCHEYLGCKYGDDCPVEKGWLSGLDSDEFFDDSFHDLNQFLESIDNHEFIHFIKNHGEAQAIFKAMEARSLSLSTLKK